MSSTIRGTPAYAHPHDPGAYVGIDPGLNGAIGIVPEDHERESMVVDMPFTGGAFDAQRVNAILLAAITLHSKIDVAIELQHPMPKQGSISGFALGRHYGQLLGVLAVLGVPVREVRAREWQKVMLPAHARGETKSASLAEAARMWPHIELTTKRGRKLDGRADALLIAAWLRHSLLATDLTARENGARLTHDATAI